MLRVFAGIFEYMCQGLSAKCQVLDRRRGAELVGVVLRGSWILEIKK